MNTKTINEEYLIKYSRWPSSLGVAPFEGYIPPTWPSWVLYKKDQDNTIPVAAIANDNETSREDVIIRYIESKEKGAATKLVLLMLEAGVTISTGKAGHNSVSPSAHKMFTRIDALANENGFKSVKLGLANNRGKNYSELDGVDVQHYKWTKL